MGLYAKAKGLSDIECYNGGYIRFGMYRKCVAKAFNERLSELYEKTYQGIELTNEEIEEYNKLCNDDLDIFLMHSDCDDKITPDECKKIYNVIKDLKVDINQNNMHEKWLNIFKHCYEKRVNLYFS
jgi:hypothetical protein